MNIDEIKSKTKSELDYELGKSKRELFDMRFKSATQSVPSPAQIRKLRRTIARINTVLHERATAVRGQEPR